MYYRLPTMNNTVILHLYNTMMIWIWLDIHIQIEAELQSWIEPNDDLTDTYNENEMYHHTIYVIKVNK